MNSPGVKSSEMIGQEMVVGRMILREADCVKKFHDEKKFWFSLWIAFPIHCFNFLVLIQKYTKEKNLTSNSPLGTCKKTLTEFNNFEMF